MRFMRALCTTVLIAMTAGTAGAGRVLAQSPAPTSTATTEVATPLVAEQLEDAGLRAEAAAEALRALPDASAGERARYIALLSRIRDENRASDDARRKSEFSARMAIADELSRRGLQDEARRLYVSAAEGAPTVEERLRALNAAKDTTAVRIIDGESGERIWNGTRALVDNGAAALLVAAVLAAGWMFVGRPALAALESRRQQISNRAIVRDFQDGTNTGLGKGLPALVRTIYREQQEFQAVSPGGSVLVPYHVPGGLPVLSAPAAESDLSWVGLSVAGTPVKDVLARWSAAWHAPWSTTAGTIYQLNGDTRVSVSIETYGQPPVAWDSSLQEGVNPPRDAAYRVLFTILDQWERRHA